MFVGFFVFLFQFVLDFSENVIIWLLMVCWCFMFDQVLYVCVVSGYWFGGLFFIFVDLVIGKLLNQFFFWFDILWFYELGWKVMFILVKLFIEVVLYQICWKDIQVFMVFVGFLGIGNVGRVWLQGLEWMLCVMFL